MRKAFSFLYFFVCTWFLFSITALAYIDPSAMTYIIQIIAGVAIAAGAAFGFYFRKLKRKFSRFGKKKERTVSYEDEEDDDDTGFGDYEIGGASPAGEFVSGGASPAGEPVSGAAETAAAAFLAGGPAAGTAFQAGESAMTGGSGRISEPVFASGAVPRDPYDESGGEGGLLAENRELRRLLAKERQNVEELKRALHICTAPRR